MKKFKFTLILCFLAVEIPLMINCLASNQEVNIWKFLLVFFGGTALSIFLAIIITSVLFDFFFKKENDNFVLLDAEAPADLKLKNNLTLDEGFKLIDDACEENEEK
jgi:hypothetical protein